MSAKTSFQKKGQAKALNIPGTRPSLANNQLLVSTGIPSWDHVIGGGIAVGTVVLIEEDVYGHYSRLMLKYFTAESIMSHHSLLLAAADPSPQQMLQDLPGVIEDEPLAECVREDDNMKIAWRYQNKPPVQTSTESASSIKFGHYYDLSKSMAEDAIHSSDIKTFNPISSSQTNKSTKEGTSFSPYAELLTKIHDTILEGHFKTAEAQQVQQRNILRIGIHSLGSPMWGLEEGSESFATDQSDHSLPCFLYALRSLMRISFAVCLVTIPTHLFHDPGFIKSIEHLSDTVIHLDSFVGSSKEKNPVFKEYHGLFNILKLPRLNSMVQHMPDTLDLAFKLKKKKFMIERLHLPPELSETASRDQESAVGVMPTKPSCATQLQSKKLDF